MFGEARCSTRLNSHQGQFEKKRALERRWEQSVEGITRTEKARIYGRDIQPFFASAIGLSNWCACQESIFRWEVASGVLS